jgi:uncharacterized membrane protein
LAKHPKKSILKVILAVLVNVALFTALIVFLTSGIESILWSIVLPSACHIVLCITLIFFLHKDSDWNFFF